MKKLVIRIHEIDPEGKEVSVTMAKSSMSGEFATVYDDLTEAERVFEIFRREQDPDDGTHLAEYLDAEEYYKENPIGHLCVVKTAPRRVLSKGNPFEQMLGIPSRTCFFGTLQEAKAAIGESQKCTSPDAYKKPKIVDGLAFIFGEEVPFTEAAE